MSSKRKIYISIIIFAALTVLLIGCGIYPLFLDIQKTSREFFSHEQKLMALEAKIESLERFEMTFPEISPDLARVDNLFIDQEVPIDFIDFLQKEAAAVGLSIEILDFVPKEDKPWTSIDFRLNLTSSFSDFLKFLEKIETGLYLTEIQSVTISRLTEAELTRAEFFRFSLGDIKANLSIKVYAK